MDRAEFANPGTAYRGVTLWMLNDELERDEIARQLKGLYNAGWGAMIGRTFNGLLTEYMSEEWMGIIREIVDGAKETGMKVWLQAGYMPSGIPDLKDEQKYRVVARKAKDEEPEEGDTLLCEDDEYRYYQRVHGTVLDLLNPQAVYEYLDLAYKEPWGDRFGDEFGKTVEAIWVDEPHFRPPLLPWSPSLPERFEQQWGYSIIDNVPSLFGKTGDWRKVRHHYWRVVLGMFLSAYFEQVGRWCGEHGVKFSGHLMGEDTLNAQIGWTGACMPAYTYMQLPGIDHLTGNLTWPTGKNFILPPKQCSSASNQLGRTERLVEIYGVSTQGLSFEDRKWIADWMMMLGINYRCYHGSFYSMRGRRKRIYAPHLSYQQPWWEDNRLIADRFSRLSYVMRQGQYCADVCIVHPVESAWCIYDPLQSKKVHDRTAEPTEIKQMNDAFASLGENLLQIQRGFEYGDEFLMGEHGQVTDGGLQIGEMTYKAVIIPPVITLRQSTVDLLKEFAAAGGAILSTGQLPTRINGEQTDAIAELNVNVQAVENSPKALKAALDALLPATVEVNATSGDSKNVYVHERALDGERVVFVTNPTRDQHVEAEIRIRGAGALQEWDLDTGEARTIAQRTEGEFVVTQLSLPPVASHLLVLNEQAAPEDVARPQYATETAAVLTDGWRVKRHTPNALTLDFCRYRKDGGNWSEQLPVIALHESLEADQYDGPIDMQFRFVAESKPKSIRVAIEDAAEYAITVNGKSVSYDGLPYFVDRSFHPVDITEQTQVGENIIVLSRHFRPMPRTRFSLASLFEARRGVELESIYLIGDFAVKVQPSDGEGKPKCLRITPEMVLTDEAAECGPELAMDGYPFFVGRISLSKTLDLEAPAAGQKVFLTLPTLDAALAKVRVNGQDAGAVMWAPYELDITAHVQQGQNEVEVEFITGLRNLMGPHHRMADENSTWRQDFSARVYSGPDWYARRDEPDVDWTNDYFIFPLGFQGKAAVEYRSQSNG